MFSGTDKIPGKLGCVGRNLVGKVVEIYIFVYRDSKNIS